METRRLYEENPHLNRFTARVLSCTEGKQGYAVVLDQTAFYPEGGGQPGDTGFLSGVRVTDTHEVHEQLVHYCDAPLTPGETVEGQIDWERRFAFMQLHSGEHILSGIIHRRFGYDNTGFHMGAAMTTIDFSGILTWEELREIEQEANLVIWRNVPIETAFPDAETLAATAYRSKKALTGRVRLVTVTDVDTCACCGTHVTRTGEIGLIKIFSCQKFHEGVRLEILCGASAYDYVTALIDQNRQNSALLSAQPLQTAAAVQKLLDKQEQTKFRVGQLERKYAALQVEKHQNAGDVLLFEQDLSPEGLRLLATDVAAACGGLCAVFSGSEESGYSYCLAQTEGDLRDVVKQMNTALNGRGGGKGGFAQGSVRTSMQELQAYFAGRIDK